MCVVNDNCKIAIVRNALETPGSTDTLVQTTNDGIEFVT